MNVFFRKTTCIFVLILEISCCFIFAHQTSDRIKVGYYENEVFQEGASLDKVKKGYAYEYYRTLSEYTGWKYEYVYGDFADLYEKLKNGEIDMLAGLVYSPERADEILFETLPMGESQYYLIKKKYNTKFTSTPSSLNGARIGVQNSIMVTKLNEWLHNNKVSAEVIIYDNSKDLLSNYENNNVDAAIIEDSGTYRRSDSDAFIVIGKTDYYLCVSKGNLHLLAELNNAHQQILTDNPYYFSYLTSKYYPNSISSQTFSDEGMEYIKSHNHLTIGYLNNYLPYCDTDSNGNVTGFLKDIIPEQMLKLGLSGKITINYRAFDNYKEMLTCLKNDQIDIAFPVGGGLYYSELNDFYQSHSVITTSVGLVFNGVYEKDHTPVFGVNRNNDMQYFYVKTNFPDSQIKFYDSAEEGLDGLLKNEIDYITINGMRVDSILKNSKYKKLDYRLLSQVDERCFGVRLGNKELLRIVNKGIDALGEQYILNQAYPYMDELHHYSFRDYLKNLLLVFIPIVFITVLIILHLSHINENKLKKLNEQLKSVLVNGDRYVTDMIRYASSEADADKILNQIIEYIGINTKSDRVYVFEENKNHTFDNTYEWCDEGISKEKDNLQGIPYEFIGIWIEEFKNHENLIINDVEEYKSVSQNIYDILKLQGIHSLAAVPLLSKGKVIGFVGVDNPGGDDIKSITSFLNLIEFFFIMMISMRDNVRLLQESATHDQLTGCKNRKALVWAYEGKFNQEKSISVIAIDMNGLKQINDSMGHEAGDQYICKTASVLCEVFGIENVYRMGGDEFNVVLTEKTKESFDELMNMYILKAGSSVSVGSVFIEKAASISFDELMRKADFEMYKAKDIFYQNKRSERT